MLLTSKQVADYLRIDRQTVCNLARDGKLPGFKLGRQWRFKKELLESFIEENSNQPSETEIHHEEDTDATAAKTSS